MVALNELVKDAEKRRQQLASGAELKQQLNQLKNLQQGPAEKLGQALKKGDMKKAIAELDKLKAELAGDKLDAKAKEQLAQQLDHMQQAFSKIARRTSKRNRISRSGSKPSVAPATSLKPQTAAAVGQTGSTGAADGRSSTKWPSNSRRPRNA